MNKFSADYEFLMKTMNVVRWVGLCPIDLQSKLSKSSHILNITSMVTCVVIFTAIRVLSAIYPYIPDDEDFRKNIGVYAHCIMDIFTFNAPFVSVIVYRREWKEFQRDLDEIEIRMQILDKHNTKSGMLWGIIFHPLLQIILVVSMTLEFLQDDFYNRSYLTTILFHLPSYSHSLVSFFLYQILNIFTRRYRRLERSLINIIGGNAINDSWIYDKINIELAGVRKIYIKLYSAVRSLDVIFGWTVFFVFVRTSVLIMVDIINSATVEFGVMILFHINSFLYGFNMTLVANLCYRMERSSQHLIDTLYRLQLKTQNTGIRKELIYLAEYFEKLQPKCTAAGFFIVNRSSLLAMLSVTVTCAVVSLQFSN